MSNIDKLLSLVRPPQPISELPSDIEEVPCGHNTSKSCLKCKKCKSISGTSRQIHHFFNCPYKSKEPAPGPYVIGTRVVSKTHIDPELSECILQKEYATISNNSTKTILGTFGAGPCIILCMRDRRNGNTILAHIPALARDPLNPFLSFPPEDSDVYIIGGNNSSRLNVDKILIELKARGYMVTFAYIIDNETSNMFAINCATGETWLNDEIRVSELPVTIDKQEREGNLFMRALTPGLLIQVNIPDKSKGGRKRKNRRSTRRIYRRYRKISSKKYKY